jgi:uncharacterized LabA/DUF88 family protein
MRTIVYIDGFNLYYSLLTKTAYKWLDLKRLFDGLVRPIEPAAEIALVRYFTAPILGSMACDPRAEQRQARYHRALKARGRVEIVAGNHIKVAKSGLPLDPCPAQRDGERCRIQLMEEKQTDVNLAVSMYRDAACLACDLLVLCSNDSDLEPALRMVRRDFPDVRIGLVLPLDPERKGARRAGSLEAHADWTRAGIPTDALAASQLPDKLLDSRKRSINKPNQW